MITPTANNVVTTPVRGTGADVKHEIPLTMRVPESLSLFCTISAVAENDLAVISQVPAKFGTDDCCPKHTNGARARIATLVRNNLRSASVSFTLGLHGALIPHTGGVMPTRYTE